MIRLAVGLCKFSENVDGFLEQSLFWSALCFEHVVQCTAKAYGVHIGGKELCLIIDELCGSSRIRLADRDGVRQRLNMLKAVRNRMFHSDTFPITFEQAEDMVRAIVGMAEPALTFDGLRKEITYEQVRSLRDGMLKVCRSPLSIETLDERGVCDLDFDDLEVLYEKCKFLHFRKLKGSLSSFGLQPEEMSELIPTSGTIWLPWVRGQPGNRRHVRNIVLGVNLAPSFVRIGIDFGSEAYRAKEVYYALLFRGTLDSEFTKLSGDYCLMDTFWYFNIRNLRQIKDCLPCRVDEIRQETKLALEETKEKCRLHLPMKGHRLLIGRVLRRDSPEFHGFLADMPETIKRVFGDLLGVVKQVEQSSKILLVEYGQ